MKLNFCLPHETIYKDKDVDQVIFAQQESLNGTKGSKSYLSQQHRESGSTP